MSLFSNKYLRRALQIAVFLILVLVIISWQTRNMLEEQAVIPTFTLPTLNGQTQTLLQASNQRPSVLYFFAPWCGICRVSMPKLNYLNADKMNIYAIALSYDNPAQVQKFVQETGYEGQVLLAGESVQRQFQVDAFPSYYILNAENKITHKGLGLVSVLSIWWQTLSF